MLLVLLLLGLAGVLLLAVSSSWPRALLIFYAIGLLQEPLRKVVPDQPPYVTLALVPVWLVVVVQFFRSRPARGRLFAEYPRLRLGAVVVGGLLAVASVVTLYGYPLAEAVPLVLLGWLGCSLFGSALAVGYQAAGSGDELAGMVSAATLCSALVLLGVFVECRLTGPAPMMLGPLQVRPWLHTMDTGAVPMLCGLFRSPEVAGWQAAMVCVLATTLFLLSRPRLPAALWPVLWGIGMVCCLLSGRRKMLAMVVLFTVVLAFLFLVRRDRARLLRLALVVLGGALVAVVLVVLLGVNPAYLQLAGSTPFDVPGRLEVGTIGGVPEALSEAGWLGHGLGSATPGIQHLQIPCTSQFEGGLPVVAYEGGWVGLVALLAGAALLLSSCLRALRSGVVNPATDVLSLGLFVCIFSNVACGVVGHQIFGDPFTITLVGFLSGVLLSCRRLARVSLVPCVPDEPAKEFLLAEPDTMFLPTPQRVSR